MLPDYRAEDYSAELERPAIPAVSFQKHMIV
jgi:hypothetical protein